MNLDAKLTKAKATKARHAQWIRGWLLFLKHYGNGPSTVSKE